MRRCHQGRGGGFALSCAKYVESSVLLDLPSARRKQREESITAGELSALRGSLGQLMWLATHVIPQLQAPSSLLLGYVGAATVSTMLEEIKLARRALVRAQTPLRTHVHNSFCVLGWSDASLACCRKGSSQGGHLVGITDTALLKTTRM